MSKILITGGAGFIGSHIVDFFLKKNFKVNVIDDLSSGLLKNINHHKANKNFLFIKGDINNSAALKLAINKCSYVIHCAVKNVRYSILNPLKTHKVNATGTINLLNLCLEKKISKFIYCSSSEVYGNTKKSKINEKTPCYPTTIYGASKLTGEYYTLVYKNLYKLNAIVLRPFNAYGERAHQDSDKSEVIYRFIARILQNKRPYIYGNGQNSRDFTYVKDIAEIFFDILKINIFREDIINVGYGSNISVNKLFFIISNIISFKKKPIYTIDRPGDIYSLSCDNTLLRKILKKTPSTKIEDGLNFYINSIKKDYKSISIEKFNWRKTF